VPARQYFQDCYIEGHVDFIFGDSMAVFDRCVIHGIAHSEVLLTAQSKRYPEQQSGYVFDHCKITADAGVGKVFLGRPWRAYSKVVFLNAELDAKVSPQGWREWHAGETTRLKTAFYAEYKSTGPGAAPELRETDSKQLTEAEAERYKAANFLAGQDGWNPTQR
jgi:pectin methylesterase-like acyl-CoA thioesterase